MKIKVTIDWEDREHRKLELDARFPRDEEGAAFLATLAAVVVPDPQPFPDPVHGTQA